ncbi:MAG: NYN domain-containing protein [Bacteroidia bacterium]|nr:NYN domain-containing protein [Bacteroidia bacterium]
MSNSITRMSIFIDGSYLYRVSTFYKFDHSVGKRISFDGLINYLRKRVAYIEQIQESLCLVTESHWFKGKLSMPQIRTKYPDESERLRFMEGERSVDDALMFRGIVQHTFPVKVDMDGYIEEKGIDVWLANEALQVAYRKNADIMVLVASDTNFVPLVRKLAGLGVRTLLVGWDVQNAQGLALRTSQYLINECAYYLPLHEYIDAKDSATRREVDEIFYD